MHVFYEESCVFMGGSIGLLVAFSMVLDNRINYRRLILPILFSFSKWQEGDALKCFHLSTIQGAMHV